MNQPIAVDPVHGAGERPLALPATNSDDWPGNAERALEQAIKVSVRLNDAIAAMDSDALLTSAQELAEMLPGLQAISDQSSNSNMMASSRCRDLARELRARMACSVMMTDVNLRLIRRILPELASETGHYAPHTMARPRSSSMF